MRGFLVRHALFLQEEQSEIHRKAATFGAKREREGERNCSLALWSVMIADGLLPVDSVTSRP